MTTYDNLDEAVMTQKYLYKGSDTGSQLSQDIANAAVSDPPQKLLSNDLLLAQDTTAYDPLGQIYESADYLVDANGNAGNPQITSYWYNPAGNQLALEDPQSNVTTWALRRRGPPDPKHQGPDARRRIALDLQQPGGDRPGPLF